MSAARRFSPAIVCGVWACFAAVGVTSKWSVVGFLILMTISFAIAELERQRLRRGYPR